MLKNCHKSLSLSLVSPAVAPVTSVVLSRRTFITLAATLAVGIIVAVGGQTPPVAGCRSMSPSVAFGRAI